MSLYEEEEAKEYHKNMVCKEWALSLNFIFAAIIILAYLSKSCYEKVILIQEAKNTTAVLYAKATLCVQVMISALIYSVTNVYLNLDPDVDEMLNNMAGLIVLNEFDQFMGNTFQIKVFKYVPNALENNMEKIVDDYSQRSKRVAQTFTNLFIGLGFANKILRTLLQNQVLCP